MRKSFTQKLIINSLSGLINSPSFKGPKRGKIKAGPGNTDQVNIWMDLNMKSLHAAQRQFRSILLYIPQLLGLVSVEEPVITLIYQPSQYSLVAKVTISDKNRFHLHNLVVFLSGNVNVNRKDSVITGPSPDNFQDGDTSRDLKDNNLMFFRK